MNCLSPAPGGTYLEISAKPKASKSALGEEVGGALTVRLTSPPAEGAANEELTKLLSKALKIPKTSIEITRGATSRHKRLLLKGVEPKDVEERLKGVVDL